MKTEEYKIYNWKLGENKYISFIGRTQKVVRFMMRMHKIIPKGEVLYPCSSIFSQEFDKRHYLKN